MIAQPRLRGLQSLRGIAAFAVVLQHVTYYACLTKGVDYLPYLRLDFGALGVELFFVISGFVMAGCLSQGKRFLLNRFTRIYPGFWLSIGISFALLRSPVFAWTFGWKAALLVPSVLNASWRIPYWTLVYEMAFYVATYGLTLFCASKRTVTPVLILWLLAIVLATKYASIAVVEPGSWILLGKLNVYFILGMLTGVNFEELKRAGSRLIALGAVILWSVGDAFVGSQPLQADFALAMAFCGVVVLGIRHIKVTALERLGDVSYGVYLLHVPVAVLTIHLLASLFPAVRLPVLWGATLAIALVGAGSFGWFENNLHARIKRLLRAGLSH
jgi:exopolysaccharide production protein ExoZ